MTKLCEYDSAMKRNELAELSAVATVWCRENTSP
jgi:hypothetical protein